MLPCSEREVDAENKGERDKEEEERASERKLLREIFGPDFRSFSNYANFIDDPPVRPKLIYREEMFDKGRERFLTSSSVLLHLFVQAERSC
jgi:hypothetical protein